MRPRTKRQREILDFINEFVDSHGHDPSYSQIALSIGVSSKSGVAKHIRALEELGLITRRRSNGRFRLELNRQETVEELISRIDWLKLPESIAAEDSEDQLLVPTSMTGGLSSSRLRGYRVRDNRMRDDHIVKGDIALIELREFTRDRDCVLATIKDSDVLLCNYRRDGANIQFIPANDQHERQSYVADEVNIHGVFRGLLRPLQ